MEEYKQILLRYIEKLPEKGYEIIYRKESSEYVDDHYEPAAIYTLRTCCIYVWMLDGNIKDCTHPVIV